jgi:demethylmenaquinone methyltransferase/2-methoxy-6-polyprenyl-1,4-benzoquinol methylase/phosphoethanolamine N-methyltransferase
MQSATRAFSEGAFDFFDELSESLLGWVVPGGPHTNDVLRHAHIEARSRLLDIGCGTGRLLAQAARREPSAVLVGIDTDRDSIEIARDRARSAPGPIELHLASAEKMPFTSDYFDVAVAVFLLGALPAPTRQRVLAEALRVLKPGGRLLAVDWARGGCVAARIAYELISALPLPSVLRQATGRKAGSALTSAGFEEVAVVRQYCTAAGAVQLVVGNKTGTR